LTGHIYALNSKFAKISGRTVEEMINIDWMSITHPDDVQEDLDNMALLNAGKINGFNMDKRYIRPDGSHVWINMTIAPVAVEDKAHPRHLCMIDDITEQKEAAEERKQLQDKLQRAQKMEAMGLMAGGIAHDLNNILSGIVSYPELLLMDLPKDSPLRKPIKTIQESGMRAADVVEDLLTIARGVASGKEILNLNAMVEEYLDSTEHQKLEKIHPLSAFKTELDSELLNITGSASHVKKVLMNLVTNASEAIEGSGTVTISTANRYLDEPLKGYEDVSPGEYVMLTVSDDGSGISSEDTERIFEPFYTKKVMGRSGTGLGLAVVWNSMQDHKGYINVKSSERGTAFELYFPVTREEVADKKDEVPLENYKGHGEKILVVDDEERQREIAGGILTRLGYIAEAVSSGEEAIEYVKEHPVALIVLDMVMPQGINGRKTYEEIIKIRPGQKAIIASGYAKTKEVDLAQELGAGKYIKKPYILEKIGLAVKEELEK
jgi:two-component system, cell cycle sensor histidine kinase and response regulator CckA